MSRKTATIDLAEALGRQAERAEAPEPAAPAKSRRAPSRAGQTNISGWFDMAVKLNLDELRVARQRALGRRVTQQELLSEAYNDLFRKYGLPETAPSAEGR